MKDKPNLSGHFIEATRCLFPLKDGVFYNCVQASDFPEPVVIAKAHIAEYFPASLHSKDGSEHVAFVTGVLMSTTMTVDGRDGSGRTGVIVKVPFEEFKAALV